MMATRQQLKKLQQKGNELLICTPLPYFCDVFSLRRITPAQLQFKDLVDSDHQTFLRFNNPFALFKSELECCHL